MAKIIHKGNLYEKAVALVKESAFTGKPIAVWTLDQYRNILDTAKNLGLEIPKPIMYVHRSGRVEREENKMKVKDVILHVNKIDSLIDKLEEVDLDYAKDIIWELTCYRNVLTNMTAGERSLVDD